MTLCRCEHSFPRLFLQCVEKGKCLPGMRLVWNWNPHFVSQLECNFPKIVSPIYEWHYFWKVTSYIPVSSSFPCDNLNFELMHTIDCTCFEGKAQKCYHFYVWSRIKVCMVLQSVGCMGLYWISDVDASPWLYFWLVIGHQVILSNYALQAWEN